MRYYLVINKLGVRMATFESPIEAADFILYHVSTYGKLTLMSIIV